MNNSSQRKAKREFFDALRSLDPHGSGYEDYSQAFYDSIEFLNSEGLKIRLNFYKSLEPEKLLKALYDERTVERLLKIVEAYRSSQKQ